MEAEARSILLDALEASAHVDLSWIEQFIGVGNELGGVELEILADEPATFASL